jgi:hypothetical protein
MPSTAGNCAKTGRAGGDLVIGMSAATAACVAKIRHSAVPQSNLWEGLIGNTLCVNIFFIVRISAMPSTGLWQNTLVLEKVSKFGHIARSVSIIFARDIRFNRPSECKNAAG